MKRNKNVIVFGGSGFIGSHIADIFSQKKFNVFIFDKKESQWLKNNQIFIKGDILDKNQVNKSLKNMEYVFHFAGISDIQEADNNPTNTFDLNVIGTLNVINGCIKNNIKRLVFASTIYVYSNAGGFYKTSKQISELLIKTYNEKYNLPFTCIRFGSIYGRRSPKTNFIHNVIHQALTKEKMERKGDGEEIREYIHVQDVADICFQIIDNEYKNKTYIITGSRSIKIKNLLDLINEILEKKVKIIFNKKQKLIGHYSRTPYYFDNKLSKNIIFDQKIDLGEGILDMLCYIQEEIEEKNKK